MIHPATRCLLTAALFAAVGFSLSGIAYRGGFKDGVEAVETGEFKTTNKSGVVELVSGGSGWLLDKATDELVPFQLKARTKVFPSIGGVPMVSHEVYLFGADAETLNGMKVTWEGASELPAMLTCGSDVLLLTQARPIDYWEDLARVRKLIHPEHAGTFTHVRCAATFLQPAPAFRDFEGRAMIQLKGQRFEDASWLKLQIRLGIEK